MIDEETKVVVQGITGEQGSFHTEAMREYGTNIVAGVTPGKGGQHVAGVPVYDSIEDAVEAHELDWSIGFVPPRFAKDAAMTAIEAGLHTCVITEHIPVHDAVDIVQAGKAHDQHVIGPNCPGMIAPGQAKLGIMPGEIFTAGSVGVVSRSGTLTYEIVDQLTQHGYGQSLAVGMGGDPVVGRDFLDWVPWFDTDPGTDAIVVIGEIGGDLEERTARLIEESVDTPVIAYITGRTAPEGKQMGHAGAIVHGDAGSASSKVQAFEEADVPVASLPSEIPELLDTRSV
ncbi:MAG: succinate--CoA ligase subunit alpha [Candidatus Nanohaloarchaeota archaeon QJJ-5]|nr:succinate--CoA ligase subunit alpha [Candidatus Nanohaloarchaeota archaeon QJJ-5]